MKRNDKKWWTEMRETTIWRGAAVAILLSFSLLLRSVFSLSFLSSLCLSSRPPILPRCSISLLAAFEVPPLQVQNAVSWDRGGEEGRGKTPTTSKGFSWVVGRWGLFLVRWWTLKQLSLRWRRKANSGEIMSHVHYCQTAMQYTRKWFFPNMLHILLWINVFLNHFFS